MCSVCPLVGSLAPHGCGTRLRATNDGDQRPETRKVGTELHKSSAEEKLSCYCEIQTELRRLQNWSPAQYSLWGETWGTRGILHSSRDVKTADSCRCIDICVRFQSHMALSSADFNILIKLTRYVL